MKWTHLEYDITTGEITCIRTFDAEAIPPQALAPGHAELVIDMEEHQTVAETVKRNSKSFKVNHKTRLLERRA